MTQSRFLFAQDAPLPVDTPKIPPARVPDPDERVRLHRQAVLILERVRRGPMSNTEMSAIAKKYTNRVSEIRKSLRPHGESLEVIRRDAKTGYTLYDIVPWPRPNA
jgi:hypothetical protein